MAAKEGPHDETFAAKVQLAADVFIALQRAEGERRVTAETFVAQALASAECDDARLDEIAALLEANPLAGPARQLRKRLHHQFREPVWPSFPSDKLGKLLVRELDNSHIAILSSLGVKASELAALSARDAATNSPEKFGTIEDPTAHKAKIIDLKARLAVRLRSLLTAYDMEKDILYLTDELSPQQIAEGMTKMVFKMAPGISPNQPDWPMRLVCHIATSPDPTGAVERDRRAAKDAGARERAPDAGPPILRRRPASEDSIAAALASPAPR